MNKTNNLRAYLRDLYEGIVSKKPDASRNPQDFRSEIEAIRTGGEFYEAMDVSELPEDAPDGSLALVEGEPIPEAYTVSSVDELPSNAVDGSMAIVSNNDILGGWYLNRILNLSGFDYYFKCKVLDDNNEEWVVANIYAEVFDTETNLFYIGEDDIETTAYVDTPDLKTWRGGTYRTIFITEIDDTEAEAWIRANGKKTKSLYTHENGQWVYKCEVV